MSGGLGSWLVLIAMAVLGGRGVWVVVCTIVNARTRVLIERERRLSLETVVNTLQPGSCFVEQHGDGYYRLVHGPAARPGRRTESGRETEADE